MGEQSMEYLIGEVVGILIVVIIVALASYFRKKRSKGHYDERQMAIIGKGYKYAFYTTMLINILYAVLAYGITKDMISPQFMILASAYLGIIVFAVYCILNDAYLAIGGIKPGPWIKVCLLVIVVNGVAAFFNRSQGFGRDGFMTGFSINLIIALTFGIILVTFIIKQALNKREELNEES